MENIMRVRKGQIYKFLPVTLDILQPACLEVLKTGDLVRVIQLMGAPPPNTMNHAHVELLNGTFAGLVHTNSLQHRNAR
jgi:hypothetical protein